MSRHRTRHWHTLTLSSAQTNSTLLKTWPCSAVGMGQKYMSAGLKGAPRVHNAAPLTAPQLSSCLPRH